MNGQPSNPQAVVYNISNTNGNNYVNATILWVYTKITSNTGKKAWRISYCFVLIPILENQLAEVVVLLGAVMCMRC
jgi:hypothetical protein